MVNKNNDQISSKNLRKKLFLYLVVSLFVFSLFLILLIANPIYDSLKKAENDNVHHNAEIRALAVNEWASRAVELAAQVTSRTRIREELEKYNNKEISLDQLKRFTEPKLSDAMNLSKEIIGITRLDREGKPVAQCGANFPFPAETISNTPSFKTSFTAPFIKNGRYMVVVSAPILNRDTYYVGTDLVLIDLFQLKNIIFSEASSATSYETILGCRSDGNISTVFSKAVDRGDDTVIDLLKKTFAGKEGVDDGSPVFVAAYHYLDIPDWGLVVLKNKTELYKELNTKLTYWGLTGILVYSALLWGFWLLMKPLTNRLLLHSDELNKKIQEQTSYLEEEITRRKQTESDLKLALKEAQLSREETATLLEASQGILFCNTFEEAARNIFDKCTNLIGARSGYVALLSEDGSENEVLFLEAGGLPCNVDHDLPMPIRGLREVAYRTNNVAYDNRFADSRWMKFMPEGHVKLDNVLFSPIVLRSKTIGLIGMANKPGDFTEKDTRIARSFSELAAVALTYSRIQENLKRSEEKFSKAFNNAPLMMTISSVEDGRYLDVNEAFSSSTGYSREMAVGSTSLELGFISEDEREKLLHELGRNGHIHEIELELKKADGSEMYCLFSGEIISVSGEKRLLSLAKDITDQKIMEVRLQQAQKMESIGNLAGGIAHDFNNLLFPIIGMSEMLLEDLPADSPEHESVEDILKAGKRGSELVNQILSFSRQHDHLLMPVQLQKIVKEVLKLSRATIPANIEIREQVDESCGKVMADPAQIHQVLMNLITNSFHAMQSEKGIIEVKLQGNKIDGKDNEIMKLFPDGYARLTVRDNGIGMPPDVLDKIFEPYFTTKEKGKGTGLGLAAVYGIIKEHKGDIRVESRPGEGTELRICLPLIRKGAADESHTVAYNKLEKGSEKILLVDDERPIVKLQSQMLARLGYQVTEFTNSREALENFKAHPDFYDAVITDMAMPGITGDELAKEILSVRSDIPIIVCTGFSEKISKEEARAIGINGFLMKPVLKTDLSRVLRKVLD